MTNEIAQKDDVQVGLLIGTNYKKVPDPTGIIDSECGAPHSLSK